MVSQVSSNIGTFLTKAQEMCQTVRTAAATKANAIATSLWEKMGNHQYIANAAVKAIDKMSGTALKTVTKVYLQNAKPEEKIKELREQLKEATKSNDLADAIHKMTPSLIELWQNQISDEEESRFLRFLKDDGDLCAPILEAKLLGWIVDASKQSETLMGGSDPFPLQVLTKVVQAAANHLKHPEATKETLLKDLCGIYDVVKDKLQGDFFQKSLSHLLGSENGSEVVKQAQVFVNDVLKGCGVEIDGKVSASLDSILQESLKQVVSTGMTKLLLDGNERLEEATKKLDHAESSQLELDDTITNYCKAAAKATTDSIIDNLVVPNDKEVEDFFDIKTDENIGKTANKGKEEAIKKQKGILQNFFEALFKGIFKWVAGSTGLLNKDGKVNEKFSWLQPLLRPLKKLPGYYAKYQKIESSDIDAKKKEKELQKFFGSVMEDFMGDALSDFAAKQFAPK